MVDLGEPRGERLGADVPHVQVNVSGHGLGHLLGGGAELFHVSGHHDGVVPAVEAAHGVIPGDVRSQGDEFVAFPCLDVAHGLPAEDHAHVHVSGRYRLPTFLKGKAAGGAAAFDAMAGLRNKTEIVLNHRPRLELAQEMV